MQFNFCIAAEKEREFFDFIETACGGCILLPESEDQDFHFSRKSTIISEKYLIAPGSLPLSFTTQQRVNGQGRSVNVIYPFDENINFIPVIEYERSPANPQGDAVPCRLYLRLSSISPEYRSELKALYSKLKNWIQNCASKRVMDSFRFTYYIV